MISGAAGAMAVVLGDLTKEDGPLGSFTRYGSGVNPPYAVMY